MASIYIHIPFCRKKCPYCDFMSQEYDDDFAREYVGALKREINGGKPTKDNNGLPRRYTPRNDVTIYIGGGTPSLLPVKYFETLFSSLPSAKEITVELNPESTSLQLLKALKSMGVNRLSIGVQSFSDGVLKKIGRLHDSKEAIKAIETAQKAGFKNVSIDLMYGLPAQTLEIHKKSLNIATELDIQHISAYGLKIEAGTPFHKNPPKNISNEDMWLETVECLETKGFNHYEISNFAKPDFKSKHNMNYWENGEYYGFGVSASGYINETRYQNTTNLKEYLKNPFAKEYTEKIPNEEKIKEAIFLALRMTKGIDLEEFRQNYSFDILKNYNLAKHFENGLLKIKDNHLKLTKQGMLFSNDVFVEFV